MTDYILDTDTCIFWLKGSDRVDRRIRDVGPRALSIAVITECELYYGAYKSHRREQNIAVVDSLRRRVSTLHTSQETAPVYGALKADLSQRGEVLDDADILIASIALVHRRVLVTHNTKHFHRIPGLSIEDWV
ncbi:MAG: hypothetical protein A2Z34_00180 [Planctomycetes bacterium RBG_16_59_8]|nr:MAG: hypothetical protein A2Z34_00180 [Planctomycetes bacterium RBG_16_59_8]